jgi:DNA-binding phage protein
VTYHAPSQISLHVRWRYGIDRVVYHATRLNNANVVRQAGGVGEGLSDAQRERLVERVRQLAREAGLLSDRAIAAKAELAPKAMDELARTKGGPTLATLLALCRAVGAYSLDELLGPSAAWSFRDLPSRPDGEPTS